MRYVGHRRRQAAAQVRAAVLVAITCTLLVVSVSINAWIAVAYLVR